MLSMILVMMLALADMLILVMILAMILVMRLSSCRARARARLIFWPHSGPHEIYAAKELRSSVYESLRVARVTRKAS